MLKGKDLGDAIRDAIAKKDVTKVAVAQTFGVKPSSVQGWMNDGTIAKDKLPLLWSYFADVVGPAHWGLTEYPAELLEIQPTWPFPDKELHKRVVELVKVRPDFLGEIQSAVRTRVNELEAEIPSASGKSSTSKPGDDQMQSAA